MVGISTTAMDPKNPRYSTSDKLLETALAHAKDALGAQTLLIKLNDLKFRNCEGYYSKAARACTWPCSITQMDKTDELDRVYEALVHWGDVIMVATPIRWGAASSLYYKMAERMNCVQNQITIGDKALIQNKVASVHHNWRTGQRPGRGRTHAGILFRAWLCISALPIHRPYQGMVRRRHGEQHCVCRNEL